MRTLFVLMLLAVLGALASAGFFMLRKSDEHESGAARDKRMARALAWRVGLSVTLFLLVMLGWAMGWVRPGGLPVGP